VLRASRGFAGRTVEADGKEFLAFVRSDEDTRAHKYRRRVTGRQLGLPDNVLLGTELYREILVGRDAEAVNTAELGPVGSEGNVGHDQ
jgi:hypothetical protein